MTEIEAKVKYVKLARSLMTYGVSFFLVKVRANTMLIYTSKDGTGFISTADKIMHIFPQKTVILCH